MDCVAKIVRSRRFKQRFDIITEQYKDYHKILDSSSFHLGAHNVYYVKCVLGAYSVKPHVDYGTRSPTLVSRIVNHESRRNRVRSCS